MKKANTNSIPYIVGRGDVIDDTLVISFPNDRLLRCEGVAVVRLVGLFSAFHVKDVVFAVGNHRKPLMWHGHNANGENVPYSGYYVINIDDKEIALA